MPSEAESLYLEQPPLRTLSLVAKRSIPRTSTSPA